MRTIKIESGGSLLIEGEAVDVSKISDKSGFMSSLLTLDVELSEDIKVEDIIHFFYNSKDIIRDVLSEDYESVRASVSSAELPLSYKKLRIFKSFRTENEGGVDFIYLTPEIELIPSDGEADGTKELSELNVVIDEGVTLKARDSEDRLVTIMSSSKINLLDILICFFEDLLVVLKK